MSLPLLKSCPLILILALLTMAASAQDHHGCDPSRLEGLAFLEGDWEIQSRYRNSEGKWEESVARSRIRPLLEGCVLQEVFTGVRGGRPFTALAVMTFDGLKSELQRAWVDDGHGSLVLYTGNRSGESLLLQFNLELRGRQVQLQHAYFEIKENSFRLLSRRSLDSGESWDTGWTLLYQRVKVEP